MAHRERWVPSSTVLALSVLAGLLAATAAVTGLIWQTDGAVTSVTCPDATAG
jgi:hypothetical protein